MARGTGLTGVRGLNSSKGQTPTRPTSGITTGLEGTTLSTKKWQIRADDKALSVEVLTSPDTRTNDKSARLLSDSPK